MIVDSSFNNIKSKTTVYNDDVVVSNSGTTTNSWRVKTKDGSVNAIASKVGDGLKIDAYYPQASGFIYIRQILDGIKKYEGKRYKLRVEVSKNSWQSLGYDIYVTSRYSSDDSNRIAVIDTNTRQLVNGKNVIEVEFDVPTSTKVAGDVNGLSIAFRAIRTDSTSANTSFTVHSVELKEVATEVDVPTVGSKLTQEQYNAVCEKLKELL